MPDLEFQVVGAKAAADGITPLIHFLVDVNNVGDERVQSIILQAQVRIEPVLRSYTNGEKERLVELFGTPDRWRESVHSMLLAHAGVNVTSFEGRTQAKLPVPFSYDLNLAAAKYFYGLEDGDIPLLFLFTGTVFYHDASGRLLIQRVSWDQESAYRMPVQQWRDLMDMHFPNASWLYLEREVFDELYAFKQRNGIATWEDVVTQLLEGAQAKTI